MTTPAAGLQLANVAAGYNRKTVLKDITLTVGEGEIVAVIGPNGAGKSTLLRAVIGLASVTEGEIRFNGDSIQNSRPSANVRRGIGYLAQGAPSFAELNVMQNLSIGGLHLGELELRRQIDEALELFPGLQNRKNQPAGLLSGGERQMLGLARLFIAKPRLLLLDEPSSGLHPDLSATVFERISQLHSRFTMACLIVEQQVDRALEISRRVYGIRGGRVVASGSSGDFRSKDALRAIFIG